MIHHPTTEQWWEHRIETNPDGSATIAVTGERVDDDIRAILLAALKSLHGDCVEYARINNLHNSDGSPATHHSMRQALAAIAKAECR